MTICTNICENITIPTTPDIRIYHSSSQNDFFNDINMGSTVLKPIPTKEH